MNEEVVQLNAAQIDLASEVLGAAFSDDPVFRNFAFQDDRRRLSATQWMSQLMLRYALPSKAIYTTADILKGVAIWIPPGHFPLNDFRLLQLGGHGLLFKLRIDKLLQFISLFLELEALHKTRMPQPHWYLLMLGVHPSHQNQGVGKALIQPILANADRDNLPCYLETSTADAVRFYQRLGFEGIEAINLLQESICVWTMMRQPRHK
jgi:ribosomal protein S18 acetylase RimI-like enzyme